MSLTSALLEDSNQAGIGFLLVELDTALTFLSLAETTRNQETALRNRNHARIAYESVLRYQGRVRFTIDEKAPFDDKLAEVKRALNRIRIPPLIRRTHKDQALDYLS